MSHLTAVIVDGDILTLDAVIKDGAKVDILTPLSGGNRRGDSDGSTELAEVRDSRQRDPTGTGKLSALGAQRSAFPHGSRLSAVGFPSRLSPACLLHAGRAHGSRL
ncbi:MAG: MoaD/ThiS family protein [candidate division NC10 bacterium]|nr:MoaD/ThiS family protein [candidate division NC10 bacterium]